MPLATEAALAQAKNANNPPQREKAFLVGIDVRTRGRSAKSAVTAQAAAARDAVGLAGGAPKSNGKPSIPEFDAEESLAELRTLAESAGASSRWTNSCNAAIGLIPQR